MSDYQQMRDAFTARVVGLFERDRLYSLEEAVSILGKEDARRAVVYHDLMITNDWRLVRRE